MTVPIEQQAQLAEQGWVHFHDKRPEEWQRVVILNEYRQRVDMGCWFLHSSGKLMFEVAGTSGPGVKWRYWQPAPAIPDFPLEPDFERYLP